MEHTIREAKEEIKKGVRCCLLKDDKTGEYCMKETAMQPFYLESAPGIGKTEIAKQTADELGIGFLSFSITHHTRNSLIGLPVIQDGKAGKYTEYTMSELISGVQQAVESGNEEGILLLDEFNCVSDTIFPIMLALLQTRNIGQYKLPRGWVLVLCGNPREYNRSAMPLSAAILDRVRRIRIKIDEKSFLTYAKEQRMHPLVIKYLELNKMNLYRYQKKGEQEELVTCRSWENLSHSLYACEKLQEEITANMVGQFIKSEEIALSFADFYEVNKEEDIETVLQEIFQKHLQESARRKLCNKPAEYMWNLTEQIGRVLERDTEKKEKAEKVSEKISRVLQFFDEFPNGTIHKEHIFRLITESGRLVNIVRNVKNEEYLRMCRQTFALPSEGGR